MSQEKAPAFRGAVKSLGIKINDRVWVGGHDARVRRLVNAILAGAKRPEVGPIDVAVVTPLAIDELVYFVGKLQRRLVDNGLIGVVWSTRPEDHRVSQPLANATVIAAMATRCFVECGERRLDDDITSLRFGSIRHA